MASDGALVLGRRTYEDFAAFWPNQTDNPFTPVLNERQKYVASRTLTEPLPWRNSTLLQGDAADAVARLKEQSARTWGARERRPDPIDAARPDRQVRADDLSRCAWARSPSVRRRRRVRRALRRRPTTTTHRRDHRDLRARRAQNVSGCDSFPAEADRALARGRGRRTGARPRAPRWSRARDASRRASGPSPWRAIRYRSQYIAGEADVSSNAGTPSAPSARRRAAALSIPPSGRL